MYKRQTLHLEASNSVTPIFFLPSNFLSIGQLINPETSCLNANRCAKDKHLETNFEASFSLTPKGSLKLNPMSITLKELSFKFTLILSIFFILIFAFSFLNCFLRRLILDTKTILFFKVVFNFTQLLTIISELILLGSPEIIINFFFFSTR